MRIVITGGCGFLGRRLALLLLEKGSALGPIDELVLFDNAPSALPLPDDKRVRLVTGDIADRDTVKALIAADRQKAHTDAVFHLAAIVSGQAEADTELGYRVNLDGTRAVLDACRALGSTPRLIFASSLAVYGGELPPAVGDDTALTPQTSYGAQKAIGELLVNDYSRKGYIDGRDWTDRIPLWSCGRDCRTAPPRPSPRRSSASRSPARMRSVQSRPRR
jgi:nucleoside-diphosphate-sugar epimerase